MLAYTALSKRCQARCSTHTPLRPHQQKLLRSLAILTQPPLFSRDDVRNVIEPVDRAMTKARKRAVKVASATNAQVKRAVRRGITVPHELLLAAELAKLDVHANPAALIEREPPPPCPRFGEAKKPGELLAAYASERGRLRSRDTAAAWFHLGRRLRVPPGAPAASLVQHDVRAQQLMHDVLLAAPALTERQLTNSLLAAAYTQSSEGPLVGALCDALAPRVARNVLGYRDLATALYALGRLGVRHEELLRVLLPAATTAAPGFYGVDLANAATGLARLRLASPALMATIAGTAALKPGELGPVELPALLSSLSELGFGTSSRPANPLEPALAANLFATAADRLPFIVGEMTPRGLTELAAAFAAYPAGARLPAALDLIAAEAAAKSAHFTARQAALTLWSLAVLRYDHAAASPALAARAASRLHQVDPPVTLSELALSYSALARLPLARGVRGELASLLTDLSVEQAPFNLQATATIATAMYTLGEPFPAWLQARVDWAHAVGVKEAATRGERRAYAGLVATRHKLSQ